MSDITQAQADAILAAARDAARDNETAMNIAVVDGGLITFPGGLPLHSAEGTVIGAIGVSGSTVENDHAVASAGAAAQS